MSNLSEANVKCDLSGALRGNEQNDLEHTYTSLASFPIGYLQVQKTHIGYLILLFTSSLSVDNLI